MKKTLIKWLSGFALITLAGCGALNDKYSCSSAPGMGCTALHDVHQKTEVDTKNSAKPTQPSPSALSSQVFATAYEQAKWQPMPKTPPRYQYYIFFPGHFDAQGNYWAGEHVTNVPPFSALSARGYVHHNVVMFKGASAAQTTTDEERK